MSIWDGSESGTYIIYNDMANAGARMSLGDIYRIKFDGSGKTLIKSGWGWMAELWNDPATGVEWVFTVRDTTGNYRDQQVYKFRLDGTTTTPIKVCNWQGDWNMTISGDGKYMSGDMPWPTIALTDISTPGKTVTILSGLTGCTTALSPDSQHYFAVLDNMGQNHKTIHIYKDLVNNPTEYAAIPVDTRFDVNGAIGFQQWTNDPLFFWCDHPALNGAISDFVVCRYAADYKSIEAYVKVTNTPTIMETTGDAWISPRNILSPSPNKLEFNMNDNGSAPAAQDVSVTLAADGGTPVGLSAISAQSWLTVSVRGNTVGNTISQGSLPSGIYTALVSLKVNNVMSGGYAVTLHINGTPVANRLIIAPDSVALKESESAQFSASVRDQFGAPFTSAITWTVSGGGTISASGAFTSNGTSGAYTVIGAIGTIKDTAKVVVSSRIQPLGAAPLTTMLSLKNSITGLPFIPFTPSGSTVKLPGESATGNTHVPFNGKQVVIDTSRYKWSEETCPDAGGAWNYEAGVNHEYFVAYYAINIISAATQTVKFRSETNNEAVVWMDGVPVPLTGTLWNMLSGDITLTANQKYQFIFKHIAITGMNGMRLKFRNPADNAFATGLSYEIPYATNVVPDNGFTVTPALSGKNFAVGDTAIITWTMDADRTAQGADISVSPDDGLTWYGISTASVPMTNFKGSYTWIVSDSVSGGAGRSYIGNQSLMLKIVSYTDPSIYGYAPGTFSIAPKTAAKVQARLLTQGTPFITQTADAFNIVLPNAETAYHVCCRDILGRTIFSRSITGGRNLSISKKRISAGFVYFSIRDNRNTLVKKLMNVR